MAAQISWDDRGSGARRTLCWNANLGQVHRMGERALMLHNRPYLIGFLIGLAIFAIPVYLLVVPRGPCVETSDFHMEPNVVKPGQEFHAVWTAKTLRECNGTLNRRFIDKNGIDYWVFPLAHTVDNGLPGEMHRFHTSWIAPKASPGARLVFRKDYKRWSNWVQKWILPMSETQEADFTMSE